MPGRALKVFVDGGAQIKPGQPVLVLEAMKMETVVYAEGDAVVARVALQPGDKVDEGALLIELSRPQASQESVGVPPRTLEATHRRRSRPQRRSPGGHPCGG